MRTFGHIAFLFACFASVCFASDPEPRSRSDGPCEMTGPKVVTLPDAHAAAYYSPPSSIDAGGTFSLDGEVISIRGGTPLISCLHKIDEPNREPTPEDTTAFVMVAGRELLLDGWKDNSKVAEQICYYALPRHGDLRRLAIDLKGRLEFRAPKDHEGKVHLLVRVPVVVVDSIHFYLTR